MLVLLRIGPWCHGEVVYGGFPEFIQERQDKRTSSPEYLEKVTESVPRLLRAGEGFLLSEWLGRYRHSAGK